MHPKTRQILVVMASAVIAIWLGYQLAEGAYFWPGVAMVVTVGAVLSQLLRLPLDVILTGAVIFGYLAGNRGFAQLMPAPNLPLLPAEATLLVAGTWRCIRWAFARHLPVHRNPLELSVLAWLLIGSIRFLFDFKYYKFLAIRDFATVYYAAFFFLVADMARDRAARRWLVGCLISGVLVLPVTLSLSELFPNFFQTILVVHQTPLILFKGDLAPTFLGVGSLLLFFTKEKTLRPWLPILAIGMVLWILAGDNRSSLAGIVVAAGLLLAAGKWRYPAALAMSGVLAALLLAVLALLADNTWATGKLRSATDRLHSMVDFSGQGSYMSGDTAYKGDNNRFRAIWWKNVITETWTTSPLLGLGFGHDMADSFLQEYYAGDAADDFSARSPHNIFITVFGRLGLIGLGVWLWFCAVLLLKTWRSLREPETGRHQALWCSLWVILISATFGVVLEGPMGAVLFWSILGLAHSGDEEYIAN